MYIIMDRGAPAEVRTGHMPDTIPQRNRSAKLLWHYSMCGLTHRGVDKSLARPGRKQATATEDFDLHISCLLS